MFHILSRAWVYIPLHFFFPFFSFLFSLHLELNPGPSLHVFTHAHPGLRAYILSTSYKSSSDLDQISLTAEQSLRQGIKYRSCIWRQILRAAKVKKKGRKPRGCKAMRGHCLDRCLVMSIKRQASIQQVGCKTRWAFLERLYRECMSQGE